MEPDAESLWFVAKTQPQKEAVACINLERQGCRVFFPRYLKTLRKGSRFTERWKPLFPGYVFIAAEEAPDIWRHINGTRGIAYLVGFGQNGRPAAVPPAIIQDLLAMSDPQGRFSVELDFEAGDLVQIERGPFSGLTARILSLNARGRVELLLELMGGVSTSLDVHHLRRLT